jgi:hypothetical protein
VRWHVSRFAQGKSADDNHTQGRELERVSGDLFGSAIRQAFDPIETKQHSLIGIIWNAKYIYCITVSSPLK